MAWATAADVIGSWIGGNEPTDTAKVEKWIARAERLIRATFPDLQARIDGGLEPDLLDNVNDVVVAMVTRVFRNPQGYRTMSGQQTAGPYSGNDTITFGGDNPGALVILDDEKSLLAGTAQSNGGAFSIDLMPSTAGTGNNGYYWLELGRGSEW